MSNYGSHKKKWRQGDEIQEAIVMSSAFRTFYTDTSTSFSFSFPEPLRNVTSMKLSAVEVPVDVYFTISKHYHNNVFYMSAKDVDISFTITDNNYPSCDAFVTEINRVIGEQYSSISTDGASFLGDPTYTYNTDSSCAVYATHNNYTISFHNIDVSTNSSSYNELNDEGNFINLYFGDPSVVESVASSEDEKGSDPQLYLSLGYILGYRESYYPLYTHEVDLSNNEDIYIPEDTEDDYNSYLSKCVISEIPSNLSPTKSFLVAVDDFTTTAIDNIKVAYHSSFLSKRILARVPFIKTKDENSTFIYNKYNDTPVNIRLFKGPTDIRKIKVELLDDLGRAVNLLGADWNFILTVSREP